jgi:hypothetical protein
MESLARDIAGLGISFAILLSEWLEDYHEWHLALDQGMQQVHLWDQERGCRFVDRSEAKEIFKQSAKILTYHYDSLEGRQIHPWHHAAGDFVVKRRDGLIDVKLTTVRGYEDIATFFQEGSMNPWNAIVYFLLNLTVRMRLDRLDGIGGVAWADVFSIEAALEGFLEALEIMASEKRYGLGSPDDLISLLKSFTGKELRKLFDPLMLFYERSESEDFSMIAGRIEAHCTDLYEAIQRLRE